MLKYSPSYHLCFETSLNYPNLPDDLIEITKHEHSIFTGELIPEGKKLKIGVYPFEFEDIPGPTDEDMSLIKRNQRNSFLSMTDPMLAIPDYTINDILLTEQQKTDLIDWRALLKTLPTDENWPNVDFPAPEQWIIDLASLNGLQIPDNW